MIFLTHVTRKLTISYLFQFLIFLTAHFFQNLCGHLMQDLIQKLRQRVSPVGN